MTESAHTSNRACGTHVDFATVGTSTFPTIQLDLQHTAVLPDGWIQTGYWALDGYVVIRFQCPGHADCFLTTWTTTMYSNGFIGAAAMGQHIVRTTKAMAAPNGNREIPIDLSEFRAADPEVQGMLTGARPQ
jgi:hypothetical protein